MGTEIIACLVDDNLDCTALDIGDGSIYIINADGITTPRERAASAIAGQDTRLREGTGQNPPLSKMVSHALGEPRVLKDNDFTELNVRDSFLLLSSDGLYDYVKKDTIQDIVMENGSNLEAACEELIQKALSAGSDGTITVVLVRGEYE
jgi:protein phosphatase